MEKGFNDEELSDIMNEIEALEKEFSDHSRPAHGSKEVIEELVHLDEDKTIPLSHPHQQIKTQGFHENDSLISSKSTLPTSMMFKVQGEMNLELQFDIGGKCIMLEVSPAGLSIQMDGGVTFNVPVERVSISKKAA
jgi:hypothetical protein